MEKQDPLGGGHVEKKAFLTSSEEFDMISDLSNLYGLGIKKGFLCVHFEGLTTDSLFWFTDHHQGAVSKGYYIGTYRNCRILAVLHDLWWYVRDRGMTIVYNYLLQIYILIITIPHIDMLHRGSL